MLLLFVCCASAQLALPYKVAGGYLVAEVQLETSRAAVLLDSGSSYLAVISTQCKSDGCRNRDPVDLSHASAWSCNSSRLCVHPCGRQNSCLVRQMYGGGQGFEAREVANVSAIVGTGKVLGDVGAIANMTVPDGLDSIFPPGVSGVWGIAPTAGTDFPPTLLERWLRQLDPPPACTQLILATALDASQGQLSLGPCTHLDPNVLVPFLAGGQQAFTLPLASVTFSGKVLDIGISNSSTVGALLDSGAPAIFLPGTAMKEIRIALDSLCVPSAPKLGFLCDNATSFFENACLPFDDNVLSFLPPLVLSFAGQQAQMIDVEVPSASYMLPCGEPGGMRMFALSSSIRTLVGTPAFLGRQVSFVQSDGVIIPSSAIFEPV